MTSIRVGNAAGFWGDNLDAPRLLCESGQLDYLTLEYLAELTLSILAHLKSRDADAGFVSDFPTVVESLIPQLRAQPRLKIVTNAGGMHPSACAAAVSAILQKMGMDDVRVAAVAGDDLLPQLDAHLAAGEPFKNLETGESLDQIRPQIASANAYLGAAGIVEALRQDARIVITGRVADASLTVGPAVHEFGWDWADWNSLAAATVAGHIIECGAQATGGMFSDWDRNDAPLALANVGYPIAEISDSGDVVITKPAGTDGAVTVATVAEQLVYEIGDPAHYLTPDVDANFSHVTLTQVGTDRVAVAGAQGGPAPENFKVSLAYRDGYMATGSLVICGRGAIAKARACGQMILDRVARAGVHLQRTNIETLGGGDSVPGGWPNQPEPWEVVMRVTAHDASKPNLERFLREFAPLVTAGPPGVTGYTGPRPKPYPVMAYWPTLIAQTRITPQVEVRAAGDWTL